MKHTTVTRTSDGTDLLCIAYKERGLDYFMATVFVSGTFGSGTYTLYGSPDGGTTKVGLTDASGIAASVTSAGVRNIVFGCGNRSASTANNIQLYGALASSSGASLSINIFDNRG